LPHTTTNFTLPTWNAWDYLFMSHLISISCTIVHADSCSCSSSVLLSFCVVHKLEWRSQTSSHTVSSILWCNQLSIILKRVSARATFK
jgi:hypothetical protein